MTFSPLLAKCRDRWCVLVRFTFSQRYICLPGLNLLVFGFVFERSTWGFLLHVVEPTFSGNFL